MCSKHLWRVKRLSWRAAQTTAVCCKAAEFIVKCKILTVQTETPPTEFLGRSLVHSVRAEHISKLLGFPTTGLKRTSSWENKLNCTMPVKNGQYNVFVGFDFFCIAGQLLQIKILPSPVVKNESLEFRFRVRHFPCSVQACTAVS